MISNQNKREGFKSVGDVAGKNVDFVFDLEKFPWTQFKDNSVEEVSVYHYAEYTKDLIKFMEEIWRICEEEAKVTIVAPYYTSLGAWQDPTVRASDFRSDLGVVFKKHGAKSTNLPATL